MPTLLTTGGTVVTSGETPDFTADLYDTDGSALTKAAITSLTLSITDSEGNTINSRASTNINDTGIGSLVDGASTVTLTVKPTTADTTFQGALGTTQAHYWRIDWGWTDAASVARIGSEIYRLDVERMP